MSTSRIERDSLGEVPVPADALWGAQTQRAVQNFDISGEPMPARFVHTLGQIKATAAEVNAALGLLDEELEELRETEFENGTDMPAGSTDR